jgi:hypothetical protein
LLFAALTLLVAASLHFIRGGALRRSPMLNAQAVGSIPQD